jgi:uncharacterized protein
MSFINSAIDIHSLPKTENVSLVSIHRSYLKVLRIEWIITSAVLLLIAAALIFFIPSLRQSYGWLVIATSALFIIGLYRFLMEHAFPYSAYAVREKDIMFQRGWIVRSLKICPFNRIQNCSVQSGPLERKYGLASLIIYTAGNDNADMKVYGLSQEKAETLRHFILDKIHKEENETT